ncbi:Phosphatidylinositol 4-phosphate 5-kinase type-1 alpha [Geodia barretti]|uniref:Phosphatidylinositol 4-phosphate 5-kinase type-1 alpha n=1 Tax=Geodia barretti TaxID=519541 RepID=A0AA35RVS0_GEOBA|nr:Phosphatidylinositol 4-phosphate 5-kinase type-1 alpha [Geodia barretti]
MATVSSSSSPPPTSSPTTAAISPLTFSSTPPAGTDGGLRQKAMSPQNVPAVTRRPTRSGRLGVDKQGEYTYKNTPSSTLMASLQLGLQVSIGGHEPKPRRDILMTDFEVVETVDFPADGSTITPAHKHRDFTFKTYSPEAFRFFREAFGIIAEEYLLAMCAHPMREISNPGASGSLFYLSADDAFIIKTVQKKEAHFLQKLLPGYYLCGTVNIRIVVMNNLLPSTLKYHEKYDLKGSTYKRKAVGDELGKSSPTFKDLDFQEKHTEEGGVHLLSDKYEILMKTLDRDCKVLESFGIMDYSLLLGIHNIDQTKRDGESSSRTNSPRGEGREEDRHFLVPSRIELSKNFSIISIENIPLAIEGEDPSESPPRYP